MKRQNVLLIALALVSIAAIASTSISKDIKNRDEIKYKQYGDIKITREISDSELDTMYYLANVEYSHGNFGTSKNLFAIINERTDKYPLGHYLSGLIYRDIDILKNPEKAAESFANFAQSGYPLISLKVTAAKNALSLEVNSKKKAKYREIFSKLGKEFSQKTDLAFRPN